MNKSRKKLQDKVIVITGGSKGIGKAITTLFLKNGAKIALIGRSKYPLDNDIAETLKKSKSMKYYVCDVSNHHQVNVIFKKIHNFYRKIDILINNAGVSAFKNIDQITEQDWDHEVDVNLKGVYLCTSAVTPYMKKNEGGCILNISSERGRSGSSDGSPAYAAAKAGVINLTKTYAKQLAKYNIRVNCVAPAAIDNTSISKNWSGQLRTSIVKNIPLGRLGEPEDVANACYFLVSDLSSFITGTTIDVNGGLSMF